MDSAKVTSSASGPDDLSRSVAIVGGGASGVLMAAHLLRDPDSDIRVTIIEKRSTLGRGFAFSTNLPEHVLNVRASNMSAFADDPGHFLRWLDRRGEGTPDPESHFVPRSIYGEYLGQLLEPHLAAGRLRVVDEECIDLVSRPSSLELRLANGASEIGDVCILATGHEAAQCRGESLLDPEGAVSCHPKSKDEPVLIRGTGLSMIDTCLALILRGHQGTIFAMSRRGLLPKVHIKTAPISVKSSEIPIGQDLLPLMRWFRGLVRTTVERGGGWRDVVDAMRPHTQTIWRHLPEASRRQFFRHLKPWWDIHRHRMAPQVDARISAAIASGQLNIIAGRILDTTTGPDGSVVKFRRRQQAAVAKISVSRIYDCTGLIADPQQSSNRLIRSLLGSELARVDPLRLGFDVSEHGALRDNRGTPSDRIYAVGPLTRSAFLEIEAVPDIRVQCQRLAQTLLSSTSPGDSFRPGIHPLSTQNFANPALAGGQF